MKTALNTSRDLWSGERFEAELSRMVAETVRAHNGYLERHRSVFTDNFTFKPFLLDSNLRRRRKQPRSEWALQWSEIILETTFCHKNTVEDQQN